MRGRDSARLVDTMKLRSVRERFVAKLDVGVCWEFTGAHSDGYGRFHVNGRAQYAHRVAWAMLMGDLSDELDIDHLCKNRRCCNPDHLQPVTGAENTARGESFAARYARSTHCQRQHEFTPENTYWSTNPNGRKRRACKTCQRASVERRKQAALGLAA